MNQRVLKFALGEKYEAGKEEYLVVVLICLLCACLSRILSLIFDVVMFFIGKIAILIEVIFALPVGYYSLYREEEKIEVKTVYHGDYGPYTETRWDYLYHRIPFWPRIFGRNVWLYAAVPPALVLHYVFAFSWVESILFGLLFAVSIPFFWGLLTLKVKTEVKEET